MEEGREEGWREDREGGRERRKIDKKGVGKRERERKRESN